VKFLEAIKHIFQCKNVFFIIGVDKQQLEASTKCLYGESLDFDVCLQLRADEVPPPQLSGAATATRLGLNSWLGQAAGESVLEDAIFNGVTFAAASPSVA
jgi:predicted component of type VI protein secretion system